MCIEKPQTVVSKIRQAMQQSQCGINSFEPVYDDSTLVANLRNIVQEFRADAESKHVIAMQPS